MPFWLSVFSSFRLFVFSYHLVIRLKVGNSITCPLLAPHWQWSLATTPQSGLAGQYLEPLAFHQHLQRSKQKLKHGNGHRNTKASCFFFLLFWRTMPNDLLRVWDFYNFNWPVAKKSLMGSFFSHNWRDVKGKFLYIKLWTLVQRSLLTQDSTLGLRVIRRRITIYQKLD